jgi:hypothetical protein
MDISKLDDLELFKERDRINQLIAQANTRQQVFKVLANSLN